MTVYDIVQNDLRPYPQATLRRGATVVNLSDATSVTFEARYATDGGIVVTGAAAIVGDPTLGQIEYQPSGDDTATPGSYLVKWKVTWSDGKTETFPTRTFDTWNIWPEVTP